MGLKITTPIGTDQGITSEAYVRISNYNINKQGNAQFNLQLYQNKEESLPNSHITPVGMYNTARNIQIGESFSIDLSAKDFIELESKNIFEFSYNKLDEKLKNLFGKDNVIED